MSELTIKEREKVRRNAVDAMRRRFEERKPELAQYMSSEGRDSQVIATTLSYAKAAVPVIAILAAIASAVRTVQVVSTIYSDAGSHPLGIALAALAFTLAAEGALFVLALAQAGENMRRRAARKPRHVRSLAGIVYAIAVRIGIKPPLRHDQLPEESGGIGVVIALALAFTLSTNLYMGMKPMLSQMGESNLQSFVAGLVEAPAATQMTFFVDLVASLFAPLVAYAAGHLTARYAGEIAERTQDARAAFERDLSAWRESMANPLSSEEGRELLNEYIGHEQALKTAKAAARQKQPDFLPAAPVTEEDTQPAEATAS
ncbi:MAG: hypothetical protein BroJett038_12510 [Chloroflexota bacterium]|nr:MAG: hypothetical protein BroJett038_12510 [Chloroflexota bacterium]